MGEKILTGKKNGLVMLMVTILLVIASIVVLVLGGIYVEKTDNPAIFLVGLFLTYGNNPYSSTLIGILLNVYSFKHF